MFSFSIFNFCNHFDLILISFVIKNGSVKFHSSNIGFVLNF
jgi:hypothetical protein